MLGSRTRERSYSRCSFPRLSRGGTGLSSGRGRTFWGTFTSMRVRLLSLLKFLVLIVTTIHAHSDRILCPAIYLVNRWFKEIPHGKEGYIFLGADEVKAVQYSNEIAKILFELGKMKSPEPRPFGEDEAVEHYGPMIGYSQHYLLARASVLQKPLSYHREHILGLP